MSFSIGDVYFMVWYVDEKRHFPYVDTIVFLGTNIDPEYADGDRWYFQDTKSYCEFGAFPNHRLGQGNVYELRESDLKQVVDVSGLVAELSECLARRRNAPGSDSPKEA